MARRSSIEYLTPLVGEESAKEIRAGVGEYLVNTWLPEHEQYFEMMAQDWHHEKYGTQWGDPIFAASTKWLCA